jgi:hypothetical protein
MTPEDHQIMVDFLSKQQESGDRLLSLYDVDLDARIKVVVRDPVDKPRLARATVLSKNTGYEVVLCKCGPGYTEFPFEYPCLWDNVTYDEELYG